MSQSHVPRQVGSESAIGPATRAPTGAASGTASESASESAAGRSLATAADETGGGGHEALGATSPDPQTGANPEHGPLLHVVLVAPEIPQNTGSIGRLCVGTGCRLHLVKPLGFSIDEKAVRRAGLDYWRFVDLRVHEDFESVRTALQGHRFVFTSARHGKPYTQHTFERGDVVVFGRESVGLAESFHQAYPEQFVVIPCPGPIRSLNLSNAASVVVYEGLRQLQPELF